MSLFWLIIDRAIGIRCKANLVAIIIDCLILMDTQIFDVYVCVEFIIL